MDPPIAPVGVLLRQPQDKCSGSLGDARSTWPAVRIGPAPGDKVTVPAQQRCRLDEEAPETITREQPCQRRQQRTVGGPQHGTVNLASKDRQLMAEHDDFDRQVGVGTKG